MSRFGCWTTENRSCCGGAAVSFVREWLPWWQDRRVWWSCVGFLFNYYCWRNSCTSTSEAIGTCSVRKLFYRRNYELISYSLNRIRICVKKGSDFESYDLGVLTRGICPRGTPQMCTWRMSPMILGTHRIVHSAPLNRRWYWETDHILRSLRHWEWGNLVVWTGWKPHSPEERHKV